MSSASDKGPLASVADDGRAMVILNGGWGASRDAAGKWVSGLKFSADALMESFTAVPDAAALALAEDAQTALMTETAISFPQGSEFYNVEGIPVVLVRPPGRIPLAKAYIRGKRPRPFSFTSTMHNGSPCTEAEFRSDAGLPPVRRAKLSVLVGDDGIPILVQSVCWENVGADAAKALAAAAIARAASR